MFDFYEKRKLKVLLGSPYVQAVVFLITVFVAWNAFTRFQIASEMADRREQVEIEAAVLQERKDSLETEVNYLSDERGIEAELRRQFDVAKDGEKVVVIVEEEETEEVETIPLAPSTNEKRWYQFWR